MSSDDWVCIKCGRIVPEADPCPCAAPPASHAVEREGFAGLPVEHQPTSTPAPASTAGREEPVGWGVVDRVGILWHAEAVRDFAVAWAAQFRIGDLAPDQAPVHVVPLYTRAAPARAGTGERPNDAACEAQECETCGSAVCPHGDRFHFHHDGCPSCGAGGEGGAS